jgi:hypothetical protein
VTKAGFGMAYIAGPPEPRSTGAHYPLDRTPGLPMGPVLYGLARALNGLGWARPGWGIFRPGRAHWKVCRTHTVPVFATGRSVGPGGQDRTDYVL